MAHAVVYGGFPGGLNKQICAPSLLHAKERNKTKNTYNEPKRPSIGTSHRPSIEHHRKSSLTVKSHNTNQHSNPAGLQLSTPSLWSLLSEGHRLLQ